MRSLLVLAALVMLPASSAFVVGTTLYSSSLTPVLLPNPLDTVPSVKGVWAFNTRFDNMAANTVYRQNVMVDIDNDQVMDTSNPCLRVSITDIELVGQENQPFYLDIVDATGKRWTVSTGDSHSAGFAHHTALTTPLVLPVGSSLVVEARWVGGNGVAWAEVHLIGRVDSL